MKLIKCIKVNWLPLSLISPDEIESLKCVPDQVLRRCKLCDGPHLPLPTRHRKLSRQHYQAMEGEDVEPGRWENSCQGRTGENWELGWWKKSWCRERWENSCQGRMGSRVDGKRVDAGRESWKKFWLPLQAMSGSHHFCPISKQRTQGSEA